MTRRTLALVTVLAAISLASCKMHDDNATAPTVNGLVTNQITNLTCTTNTPQDINPIAVVDDESPVDVNTLTPACTLPGG